jgi:hypothetical protein
MKHQQFTRLSKVLQPTEGNIIQVQEELNTDLIEVLICTQTGSDNNEKDMIPSNKGTNSIRRNSQIKIFFLSCFFFWGCVGGSRSGVGILTQERVVTAHLFVGCTSDSSACFRCLCLSPGKRCSLFGHPPARGMIH